MKDKRKLERLKMEGCSLHQDLSCDRDDLDSHLHIGVRICGWLLLSLQHLDLSPRTSSLLLLRLHGASPWHVADQDLWALDAPVQGWDIGRRWRIYDVYSFPVADQ
ncbi:uncharacterized protein LOC119740439 [Patiria miniata]|uniref:Uncharacterized protein n=1 Tax=Patiria miniata TaxID=46514 RepID=A0A914B625_PATMI|nr:uncharacterized protein LOC119740439 [Patiria miniata]